VQDDVRRSRERATGAAQTEAIRDHVAADDPQSLLRIRDRLVRMPARGHVVAPAREDDQLAPALEQLRGHVAAERTGGSGHENAWRCHGTSLSWGQRVGARIGPKEAAAGFVDADLGSRAHRVGRR
jgi:hypothetical protein